MSALCRVGEGHHLPSSTHKSRTQQLLIRPPSRANGSEEAMQAASRSPYPVHTVTHPVCRAAVVVPAALHRTTNLWWFNNKSPPPRKSAGVHQASEHNDLEPNAALQCVPSSARGQQHRALSWLVALATRQAGSCLAMEYLARYQALALLGPRCRQSTAPSSRMQSPQSSKSTS
jgi:hypothetical protein